MHTPKTHSQMFRKMSNFKHQSLLRMNYAVKSVYMKNVHSPCRTTSISYLPLSLGCCRGVSFNGWNLHSKGSGVDLWGRELNPVVDLWSKGSGGAAAQKLWVVGFLKYQNLRFREHLIDFKNDADNFMYYWNRGYDGCNPLEIYKLSICCSTLEAITCLDFKWGKSKL